MNANVSEITTERGLVKRISLVSVGSTNDYAINLLRTENTDEETMQAYNMNKILHVNLCLLSVKKIS